MVGLDAEKVIWFEDLHLPEVQPSLGWVARPGKVVVALARAPKVTDSGLMLPDKVSEARRPDVGVVLSDGGTGLEVGDVVLLHWSSGQRVDGVDPYPDDRLAFIGVAGGVRVDGTHAVTVPWDESILAYRRGDTWFPTGRNLMVTVELEPEAALMSVARQYQPVGRVIRLGCDCSVEVEAGRRVLFDMGAAVFVNGGPTAILPDWGVYAIEVSDETN